MQNDGPGAAVGAMADNVRSSRRSPDTFLTKTPTRFSFCLFFVSFVVLLFLERRDENHERHEKIWKAIWN
jgi:preprotein translocase subunit SecG